jgi:uncharacterized membrane protein YcjF (UPF0283 family)
MKLNKRINLLMLLLSPLSLVAQGSQSVEMADAFRQQGKIYVVVLGLVIILTGVVMFLIRVDRKLNRLEKKEDSRK